MPWLLRRFLASLAMLVLIGAPEAVAASPSPPVSSVAEYVETFPTGAGGTTNTPGARVALTGPIAKEIFRQGGSDRAALSSVVATGPKAARESTGIRRAPAYVAAGTPSFEAVTRSWRSVFGTDALVLVAVLSLATITLFVARRRRA